jgi:ABC-type Na+ efflux pump permease subunit
MMVLNKKRVIIIGLIIVAVITLIIFFSIISTSNKTTESKLVITTHIDPWSGETVSEQKNGNSKNITMLGFIKLIDIGVTYDQLTTIKSELNDYAKTQKGTVSEISIDVSTITSSYNEDTSERTITFTVVIDQKTKIKATVTYKGLGDPALTLYDSSGKQVY